MAEVLDLIEQVLRQPALDADELEVLRRQVIASLEASRNEPMAVAPRKVRRMLSPYDPQNVRYVPTIDEEIARYTDVQIDEIRQLYDQFIGNQAGEVVMVGNFDPDVAIERWKRLLDDWKAPQPYQRYQRPAHPEIAGSVELLETPDKSNAMLFAQQQYELSDEAKTYAPLVMGNFILGGGSLSSRLADRVRQQEGLSYTIRSSLSGSKRDEKTDFLLYAITNPENKDKLLRVIREELQKIRKEGVTEDELARAKKAFLETQMLQRTDDAALASTLLSTMFNQRTMEYYDELEQQIQAVTIDEVNDAIRKFIEPDDLVIAIAGDFSKVEQPTTANP